MIHLTPVSLLGAVMLSISLATSASSKPPELATEFPGDFDDKSISIAKLSVVTIADSDSFFRLLKLQTKHPLENHKLIPWCMYEGFDSHYHYASALKNPDEVYRVRRDLIKDEDLSKELVRRSMQTDKNGSAGTSLSYPASALASQLLRPDKLDRSLIPNLAERPEVESGRK